ncbi:hypothetical protein ACLOJK_012402 [Asimina triloba]
MALPYHTMAIIGPLLLSNEDDQALSIDPIRTQECLAMITKIGVTCSSELPRERMEMKDLVKELHQVRDFLLGIRAGTPHVAQRLGGGTHGICRVRVFVNPRHAMLRMCNCTGWLATIGVRGGAAAVRLPNQIVLPQYSEGGLSAKHSIAIPMGTPSVSQGLLYSLLLRLALHASLSQRPTLASNDTDRLALLAFKSRIVEDPLHALSSWNSSLHFCEWRGVSCSIPEQRVTGLNLTLLNLVGSIPPHVGNLTALTRFDLRHNGFRGEIPPQLGRLSNLQRLHLSDNSFSGQIPSNLSNCFELQRLSLAFNELTGEIPAELSRLPKLLDLGLYTNNLTGSIPPSLGNLSSLLQLSLVRNSLEGNIPADLGHLKNLVVLQISQNQLSGTIPPSIYNLSRLILFSVTFNQLHGNLPPDLFITLPNLELFYVSRNLFTGQIPGSLTNASFLEEFYITNNDFTGGVPADVGRLQRLRIFTLGGNRLGTGKQEDLNFLRSLPNCTNLEKFGFHENSFGGVLPNSIANLSTQLDWLAIGYNHLSGNFPAGIGNLIGLEQLNLDHNLFTGTIPVSIGNLQKMKYLDLSGNKLSGQIPSSIGRMTELSVLYLQENGLWGSIPSSLGNCRKLNDLNLSQNSLSGSIPKEVVSLSSLSISLNLAGNSLTGPLPAEVGRLKALTELDISSNRLSGKIPVSLSACESLERLHMEGNSFHGTIPLSLGSLRGLEVLDLSRNNFSGQIPSFLEGFTALKKLNLSYNEFEGEVPMKGVFGNGTISMAGNVKLCGGSAKLKLPTCIAPRPKRRGLRLRVLIPVIVITTWSVLFFICFLALCLRRKSRKQQSPDESSEEHFNGNSYAELLNATGGFSSENLIGVGSYGSVYKGYFPQDDLNVAVKVLNLQRKGASRSFLAECEALRNVRHRNLVKIITSCSSMDYKGNDFKALVFEYMPNGSLEEWLHPKEGQAQSLSLIQRLNIAIDVASALEYLHHDCPTPISHCDLKPSNVLLDNDMVAHVSDFGIARFLSEAADSRTTNKSSSIAIKGTIGYVAPGVLNQQYTITTELIYNRATNKYGTGGSISESGDVYSYGILLLEMFTGKRPTDDMFKDNLSIHEFVKMAWLGDRVLKIADPMLEDVQRQLARAAAAAEEEEMPLRHFDDKHREEGGKISTCLGSVFGVGVACSAQRPTERIQLKDAINKIHDARDAFLPVGIHRRR